MAIEVLIEAKRSITMPLPKPVVLALKDLHMAGHTVFCLPYTTTNIGAFCEETLKGLNCRLNLRRLKLIRKTVYVYLSFHTL